MILRHSRIGENCMGFKPVTVKDVAREAGVSPSTVSKILNQKDFGSPETRRRVMEAVEKLDYRVNAIARSLVTNYTDTIGLIIPDLFNPVFSIVAHAVEKATRAYGLRLLVGTTDRHAQVERDYVNLFVESKADGVIFYAALNPENILRIKRQNIPAVIVERPSHVPDTDIIGVDNHHGGKIITEHLLSQGRRVVGLIVGPPEGEVERERIAGYQAALIQAGIKPDPELMAVCDYTIESGFTAMENLLERRPDIDAIFVGCDIMAVGALRYLHVKGIKVPDDIAVGGYDNTLSQYTTPLLTTVAQPFDLLGEEAMRVLVDRIRKKRRMPYQQIRFTPELIVRESTAVMEKSLS